MGLNSIIFICSLFSLAPTCKSQKAEIPIGEIETQYNGGMKQYMIDFRSNVKYPMEKRSEGIIGTVYFQFEVDTVGNVVNFLIRRGVDPVLDQEVASKIELTNGKWKPLYLNGERSNYIIRDKIYFELR